MERHRIDLVSAFFGVIFTGAALTVMLIDDVILDVGSQWIWPAVILVFGLALIASGVRRNREIESSSAAEAADTMPVDPYAD